MDTIALILTIVGAINWGLIGLAKFDLVAWIFGGQTVITAVHNGTTYSCIIRCNF